MVTVECKQPEARGRNSCQVVKIACFLLIIVLYCVLWCFVVFCGVVWCVVLCCVVLCSVV